MLLKFLVQRPFDGVIVTQAEKPDFRLIKKFLGPCLPLLTHGTSEVFADATNISLQTAYGPMGANWKYLGEACLKLGFYFERENHCDPQRAYLLSTFLFQQLNASYEETASKIKGSIKAKDKATKESL